MSDTYEVVWESGHVEQIKADQVAWPSNGHNIFALPEQQTEPFVTMHATIDGKWTLLLQARTDEIRTIRNLTHADGRPNT